MSRLKYALIGHGRRGAAHLSTAATLKDTFDIVAVCDAHQESAEAGAAKVGTKAYTDVRKMVDETSPDVCRFDGYDDRRRCRKWGETPDIGKLSVCSGRTVRL